MHAVSCCRTSGALCVLEKQAQHPPAFLVRLFYIKINIITEIGDQKTLELPFGNPSKKDQPKPLMSPNVARKQA